MGYAIISMTETEFLLHNIWTTTNGYLRPGVIQLVGLTAFVSMLTFWMVTGKISTALLAASGSLVSFGLFGSAVRSLAHNDVAPSDQKGGAS